MVGSEEERANLINSFYIIFYYSSFQDLNKTFLTN